MNCREVDELSGAFALDAVDPQERRAIAAHLDACREPHAELRSSLGAGALLGAVLEPVAPTPGLRDRLMATVAVTPQERVAPTSVDARRVEPRTAITPDREASRRQRTSLLGWLTPSRARGLALAAMAAALVLAVVSAGLYARLSDREQALQAASAAIAGGTAAFRVEGEAGRGYVVETEGSGATLVLADVRDLPADRLYELWLLPEDGAPTPAGTFRPSGETLAVVQVEHDLEGFAALAVTVERERVEAPTTDPVLLGPLGG